MDKSSALPTRGYLDIGRQGAGVTLSFAQCFEQFPGLSFRRREASRMARSILASLGSVTWLSKDLVLVLDRPPGTIDDVTPLLAEIDRRLAKIADRPFSGRMVERALGITPRERSRWTKDGRLARAGTDLMRRGQLVALITNAVDEITRLMNELETIEAWREADGWVARGSPDARQ